MKKKRATNPSRSLFWFMQRFYAPEKCVAFHRSRKLRFKKRYLKYRLYSVFERYV